MINRFKQFLRFIHINYVVAKNGIDTVVLSTRILYPLRFISYLNPWNWWRKAPVSRGEAIRKTLEELGPIFVKFGQIVSTRRDVLPDDIANELAKLQDNVPPFGGEEAKAIVEKAFAVPIHDIFIEFDNNPLASASIAQVHAATLQDGSKVVVKIQRPNIEQIIRQDVALLYMMAKLFEFFWSRGKFLKPTQIVAEFERTIIDELDLVREAANATQLRRNFIHSESLYIPRIHWSYVKKNVIVMERIRGIPISHTNELEKHRVNMKVLAETGVKVFFTQVFEHCYFHADMHPGNLFVNVSNPNNPQYIAVDFGIMGSLSDEDQHYLAENLLAFLKRDYHRITSLHIESGWVPASTRPDEFEAAIRTVCEPIFAQPLKDVSFGQLLGRLFQTASRFHMELQPQLMLLQKTLLSVEGLGRHLYPELDLWQTAQPILERWIKRKMGPTALLKKIIEHAPYWAEKLVATPDLLFARLQSKHQAQKNKEIRLSKKNDRKSFLLGMSLAILISAIVQFFFFVYS